MENKYKYVWYGYIMLLMTIYAIQIFGKIYLTPCEYILWLVKDAITILYMGITGFTLMYYLRKYVNLEYKKEKFTIINFMNFETLFLTLYVIRNLYHLTVRSEPVWFNYLDFLII